MKQHNLILTLITLSLFFSCSDNVSELDLDQQITTQPFQELYNQGIDQYLGTIIPTSMESVGNGITEYTFDSKDGPVCFTGEPFSMFTRDGSSNNLMIFLQGGGFCSPSACDAVETGIPLIPFGILNPQDVENPTRNYNLGYLPYCDDSGWMGNNEVDSDNDGTNDRFFKGIQNLSASLDVVFQNYPTPDKIVLAGNSAGGFGVHAALPLVRKLYPDVNIFVINDSGLGIANPGGMETLFEYWNAWPFIPANCNDCIGADGNLTGYHNYQLREDTNIRMAYTSSKQDETFVANFSGGGEAFEMQLIEASSELKNEFPERFNSFVTNGEGHTLVIRNFDYQINSISLKQWVSDLVELSDEWVSITE